MSNNPKILIDSSFIPDPYAEEELGVEDIQAIVDEDLRSCRFVFSQLNIQPFKIEDRLGSFVAFLCEFSSGNQTRFQSASIALRLNTPDNLKIIDLASHAVKQFKSVEFTVDERGRINLDELPHQNQRGHCTVYPSKVESSGTGSKLARWDFHEDQNNLDGIGNKHTLAITLLGEGEVRGSVTVSAHLVQPGIGGAFNAVRDLILGGQQRSQEIKFTVPLFDTLSDTIEQSTVKKNKAQSRKISTENDQEETQVVQIAKYILNVNQINGSSIGDDIHYHDKVTRQTHSGSGDNVAGDKNVT